MEQLAAREQWEKEQAKKLRAQLKPVSPLPDIEETISDILGEDEIDEEEAEEEDVGDKEIEEKN